jgi:diguanylate cyclase (GGDEF)-like protein/PAS domain S-box-containing protein
MAVKLPIHQGALQDGCASTIVDGVGLTSIGRHQARAAGDHKRSNLAPIIEPPGAYRRRKLLSRSSVLLLPSWAEAYEVLVGCRSALAHIALYVLVMIGMAVLATGTNATTGYLPLRIGAYVGAAAVLGGALWVWRNEWEGLKSKLRMHIIAVMAAVASISLISEIQLQSSGQLWIFSSSVLLIGALAFVRSPVAAALYVAMVSAGWMMVTETESWPGFALAALGSTTVYKLARRQASIFMRTVRQTRGLEERALTAEAVIKSFEESGNNWLWKVGEEGLVTYVSERFAGILETRAQELVGLNLLEILRKRVSSTDQHSAFRTLEFYVAAHLSFQEIVLCVSVQGRERWFSIAGTALFDERGQFIGYSGVGADLTAARQAEDHGRQLAMFDSLTGLANRAHFQNILGDLLARSIRQHSPCTLMFIDLDRFKIVNDTLGHPVGDELLRQVAQRIDHVLKDKGQAGRLGGDEFVIVVPNGPSRAFITSLARRLIAEISAPYHVGSSQIQIGASIGLATGPEDGATSADLIRHADLALYAAKQAGRGLYRFYEAAMGATAEVRRSLELDLRDALAQDQLRIVYQAFFDLQTNCLAGFEALLRWDHPEQGAIPPEQFIAIAEESGLIVRLGEWSLRTSLIHAATWPEHITIAVNLSPLQLQDQNFISVMMSALAASQINPERVELEITESVFLKGTPATLQILDQLQNLGVRLALDDFGTGYSSLGYLRDVKFKKLKIDKSFIRGIDDRKSGNRSIVRAVVALAKSLNMITTAEGAETPEQIEALRQIGCSQVQGFAYGKPISFAEAARLVGDSSAVAGKVILEPREPRLAMLKAIMIGSGEHQFPAVLRNISTRGAMIEAEATLELGSPVELVMPPLPNVPGTIRWTDGLRLGVMFDCPVDIEKLNDLELDRRRNSRVGASRPNAAVC